MKTKRRGATLIELMVVIGILGMVMGLILPAIQAVRGSANQTRCLDNMRQIGVAVHNYEAVHHRLPPVYRASRNLDLRNLPPLTFQCLLLPHLEHDALYRQTLEAWRIDGGSTNVPPHVGLVTVVKVFCCPADGRLTQPITDSTGLRAAYGSYIGVAGGSSWKDGVMRIFPIRFEDITDGTSTTLMLGERPPPGEAYAGTWYPAVADGSFDRHDKYALARENALAVQVDDFSQWCTGVMKFGPGRLGNSCDANHFWSLHSGGANFLFADGSARFLRYTAQPHMIALATIRGGEPAAGLD